MGFAGNLSTLSLVEVLQTINRIRATGVLRLASAAAGRDVVFKEGEIIGVAFRSGEERQALLRRLILLGKIDAATAATISSSGRDSTAIIEAMISRQLVKPEDVQDAVIRQSEDELYNLCTWEYADFVFHDASPEDQQSAQQVEKFSAQPLKISINSLLMEAARRMDEWERLREQIPNEEAVLGAATGKEQDLLAASKEYPGSAVVPLIDAVRTIEDIVHDSVATRLDVYAVIVELVKASHASWLTREDILSHASYLAEQKDFIRAAQLYRRALASEPGDASAKEHLAECLAQLGSTPEAAGCFSQLALGYLEAGNGEGAISAALRAVSLADDDPRQRLILVRCLLEQNEKEEAIAELHKVVARYIDLGQLEDARGTCLKILELDPANEKSRREMARIFATAERNADSEDVVVCVQCSHVNHREAAACAECKAPLRLACTRCGRTVAVSDKICIFCGANPHAGTERRGRIPGTPSTARLVNPNKVPGGEAGDKGSKSWKMRVEEGVTRAREFEEAGNLVAALAEWRVVASFNQNNVELQSHIKTLESRANDLFTEQTIDRGHQLRRNRRFWSALKAYRAALRAMPANDPRAPRLHEIVASTESHSRRIALIYACAIVMVLVFGGLVSRPFLALHRFRGEFDVAALQIKQLEEPNASATGALARLADLDLQLDHLDSESPQLGHGSGASHARTDLNDLHFQLSRLRTRLAERTLAIIRDALERNDQALAQSQLTSFRECFGATFMASETKALEDRLSAARKASEALAQHQKEEPAMLAKAQAAEKAGEFGSALTLYRELAGSVSPAIIKPVKEALGVLEPKHAALTASIEQASELALTDLARAEAAINQLGEGARVWQIADYAKRKEAIAAHLHEAAAAYAKLGATPDQTSLEQFLAAHKAAPQAAQAHARLDQLQQSANTRNEQLAAYQAAMTGKRYEQAWQLARTLLPGAATPNELTLPLVIESQPAGAEVRLGGEVQGQCPCVLALAQGDMRPITVALPGWQPVVHPAAELQGDWHWQAVLVRAARWKLDLGKPVTMVEPLADGGQLVQAGEMLARIDAKGQGLWRCNLALGDDLADTARYHLAHQPLLLPDGSLALGLPTSGVALIDAQGKITARLPTGAAVRGEPVVYSNEILGGHARLAFAADALTLGDIGGERQRIALPAVALSGPLVLAKELDRMLVVATIQGQLMAFEESTRKHLWDFDLKASELGQLIPAGSDAMVAVLDGSRISCYTLAVGGAAVQWLQALDQPAVGDPVISAGVVYLAAGANVVRISLTGELQPALSLPAPAVTAVAVAGDVAAVGCRNGMLVVFHRGTLSWTSACAALPEVVSCTQDKVVVGLSNGTLAAYAP
jgi:tetratricopeptide (TPR) repeat protein/outer membrane protein assembly factor BamB